jgi:hypothetical protein
MFMRYKQKTHTERSAHTVVGSASVTVHNIHPEKEHVCNFKYIVYKDDNR